MRRLLAFLGVDESELILHDCAATYRFAEVSLFRHSTRDLYVPPDHREVFTEIAARAARGSSLGPQSKVFVSRLSRSRQPGAERRLLNEEDLSVLLERLGFSTIEPDLLGPAEQIALFAGARQIVGLGGAGMFNGVFARSDAKLLDIESTAVFLDAHSNIFGSCGLEYGVMVGTEDASDCSAGHKRWTVDLRKAEPYIDFFFNA